MNLGYNTIYAPTCSNTSGGKGPRTKRAGHRREEIALRQAKLEGRWVPQRKKRVKRRSAVGKQTAFIEEWLAA